MVGYFECEAGGDEDSLEWRDGDILRDTGMDIEAAGVGGIFFGKDEIGEDFLDFNGDVHWIFYFFF